MQEVMKAIFRAKEAYATLPFFHFLRDSSLSERERLQFYPCMAPFVMDFDDLIKNMLREERSAEGRQDLVNCHAFEDGRHLRWYLEDLVQLGFDAPASTCEVISFLCSAETRVNRTLSKRLAHLWYGVSSPERLVMIKAIEEAGNVLFALTAGLARRIEAEEGITLRYLGDFHFRLETDHAGNGRDHRELVLDEAQRKRCLEVVARVFLYFEEWTQELLDFATAELTCLGRWQTGRFDMKAKYL